MLIKNNFYIIKKQEKICNSEISKRVFIGKVAVGCFFNDIINRISIDSNGNINTTVLTRAVFSLPVYSDTVFCRMPKRFGLFLHATDPAHYFSLGRIYIKDIISGRAYGYKGRLRRGIRRHLLSHGR